MDSPLPLKDVSTHLMLNPLAQAISPSSGIKGPFQCPLPNCNKSFKYKSEMQRHISSHREERTFQCPYENCGKSYKRKDALDYHKRTHTGETRYECPFPGCGQKFATSRSLKQHKMKHEEVMKPPTGIAEPMEFTIGQTDSKIDMEEQNKKLNLLGLLRWYNVTSSIEQLKNVCMKKAESASSHKGIYDDIQLILRDATLQIMQLATSPSSQYTDNMEIGSVPYKKIHVDASDDKESRSEEVLVKKEEKN